MNLPLEFIQTIESVFEEDGKRFIQNLPDLIADASARWQLGDVQPVSNLSFNFVAYATSSLALLLRGEGNNVVLKIGVPCDELTSEIATLKLFNGNGACRLIDSNEEKGFLLLERLKPGKMLSELVDDDKRTHIAMDVMQNMRSASLLAKMQEQAPALQKLRPYFAVPFGDMMIAGCFGLLSATSEILPELAEPIQRSLRGVNKKGVTPWDVI